MRARTQTMAFICTRSMTPLNSDSAPRDTVRVRVRVRVRVGVEVGHRA